MATVHMCDRCSAREELETLGDYELCTDCLGGFIAWVTSEVRRDGRAKQGERIAQVRAILAKDGEVCGRTLADVSGFSWRACCDYLAKLAKQGKIQRIKCGVYK
jgi:hypothetical protein